jgi:hypothetical protein
VELSHGSTNRISALNNSAQRISHLVRGYINASNGGVSYCLDQECFESSETFVEKQRSSQETNLNGKGFRYSLIPTSCFAGV